MTDTTESTDDDRTEPPISNEELYVRLGQLMNLVVLVTAGLFAGLAWLAAGTSPIGVSLLLAVYAAFFLIVYYGVRSRNGCTRLLNLLPWGDGIGETLDEEEARLTDAAATDGGNRK